MNRKGRSGRHMTMLAMLGFTIHCLGYGVFASTPSNAVLIAAMPPGTESVMVTRVLVFKAEDSIFRDRFDRTPHLSTNKNIKTVVMDATNLASPVVSAVGASDFQMPPDTGMTGNYNERAIYVVEQTLENLRDRLQAGRDVEGLDERFDVAGVMVHKGTIDDKSGYGHTNNSAGEAWFVAIPDDHTVVTAESRSDIVYMLKSLKEKRSAIPPRWRGIAAGHSLDSPLVILRQYPPAPTGSSMPPPDTGATHFALTLPQTTSALMRISVEAEDVDKAVDWYKGKLLYGAEYESKVKRTDGGVTVTFVPKRKGERPTYITFVWFLLFGPCVAI